MEGKRLHSVCSRRVSSDDVDDSGEFRVVGWLARRRSQQCVKIINTASSRTAPSRNDLEYPRRTANCCRKSNGSAGEESLEPEANFSDFPREH